MKKNLQNVGAFSSGGQADTVTDHREMAIKNMINDTSFYILCVKKAG